MTPPFGHAQGDKDVWLLAGLKDLTARHISACPAYGAWVGAMFPGWEAAERIAELPWLPVGVFKSHDLRSVPDDAVVRVLTSSGTSGQAVSRIALDAPTAKAQARTLSSIMQAVLGPKRLPMLIVDSRNAITGGGALSARGAAILGMMPFGARHAFWLDGEAEGFLATHGAAPFLIFGMTAQVWTHLRHSGADLSHGVLIHGGGWKTLAAQGVDNAQFKAELKRLTGLDRVVNFYGMAEQVGSVFLEGEDGCLHAAAAADVIIRDPQTLAEQPPGVPGLIQVVSLLPGSYPGHSILTEDWGVVESVDAGEWKGKAFTVQGRIKQAELRGCSDVTASSAVMPEPVPGIPVDLPIPLPCFDAETVEFGAALSSRLFAEPEARAFADLASLAFWLRPASTALLRRHFEGLGARQPRGQAFHIAPANVETLFVYSWWLSVLAGNATLVRVSERGGARTELLLRLLDELLAEPRFARLRRASAFIRYGRDDQTSCRLSAQADLRVVWGGDATIASFAAMPLKPGATELTFPDRRSLAMMAASAYLALDDAGRDALTDRFFNDGFGFDQKACSSPILLAWVGEGSAEARADFWPRLGARAKAYAVAPATGMAKLTEAARLVLDGRASEVTRFGAPVLVVRGEVAPPRPETCGGGIFQDCVLESLDQVGLLLDAKLQTVTHFGFAEAELARIPALRLAPMGHALDFSHIWDGQDLLAAMTRPGE